MPVLPSMDQPKVRGSPGVSCEGGFWVHFDVCSVRKPHALVQGSSTTHSFSEPIASNGRETVVMNSSFTPYSYAAEPQDLEAPQASKQPIDRLEVTSPRSPSRLLLATLLYTYVLVELITRTAGWSFGEPHGRVGRAHKSLGRDAPRRLHLDSLPSGGARQWVGHVAINPWGPDPRGNQSSSSLDDLL
jgi:hypothetical protein